MTTKKQIRDKVLADRGLVQRRLAKHKKSRLRPALHTNQLVKLTPLMQLMEHLYCNGQPLEQVLISGSLSAIAKKFENKVDRATISRWINKLRIHYTPDNLPSCTSCKHKDKYCDLGLCNVLVEQEKWELVILKKKELIG